MTQSYQQGRDHRRRRATRSRRVDLETIDALGINDSHVDAAQLAGWLLLAVLVVGLLLGWVWRFRPEIWHRNNGLLLIALVLIVTTLALKVTADRSVLPYFVPTAAVGLLLAVLLDAGAATDRDRPSLALLGGAIDGSSSSSPRTSSSAAWPASSSSAAASGCTFVQAGHRHRDRQRAGRVGRSRCSASATST